MPLAKPMPLVSGEVADLSRPRPIRLSMVYVLAFLTSAVFWVPFTVLILVLAIKA